MADTAALAPDQRRSLALARLMASRAAWQTAVAPAAGSPLAGGLGAAGMSAGRLLCLAQGRRWLRSVGADALFTELREQLQPWIRRRPGAAMAIAALLGAGLVSARPWAHPWLWRTLSELPWASWLADARAAEPSPPP